MAGRSGQRCIPGLLVGWHHQSLPGSREPTLSWNQFIGRVTSHSEVKTSPRLARSTEPEVGICEGKLTDSGWLKGPQKDSCDRFCIISDRRF